MMNKASWWMMGEEKVEWALGRVPGLGHCMLMYNQSTDGRNYNGVLATKRLDLINPSSIMSVTSSPQNQKLCMM